jgi:hypothetical protein
MDPHAYVPVESRAAPSRLLDLLGARLASARGNAYLYEALTAKRDGRGGFPGAPTRDELVQMRDDEHAHATVLAVAIEQLGGDPGLLTPRAAIEAQATRGITEVIRDPRTLLPDAIEMLVVAELADLEAWTTLIDITREEGPGGSDALVAAFRAAHATDAQHLARLRSWAAAGRAHLTAAASVAA